MGCSSSSEDVHKPKRRMNKRGFDDSGGDARDADWGGGDADCGGGD
jgi:hypothetical protein